MGSMSMLYGNHRQNCDGDFHTGQISMLNESVLALPQPPSSPPQRAERTGREVRNLRKIGSEGVCHEADEELMRK
jgi:hypothetical protein